MTVGDDGLRSAFPNVETEILIEFLCVIKDHYEMVDSANFTLEQRAGISGINTAIANMRDVLSHLARLLNQDHMTADEQREQLAGAKEHIRRATIEPYQLAVSSKLLVLRRAIGSYKKWVLPLKTVLPGLRSAPSISSITAAMNEIDLLSAKGRAAKRINEINPGWVEGVEAYIKAFTKIEGLLESLDMYAHRAWTAWLAVIGVVVALIGIGVWL